MDWETARRWLQIMAANVFDPNQPAYILILARVEELERKRDAAQKRFEAAAEAAAVLGCEREEQRERAEAAEAKLARCMEALEQIAEDLPDEPYDAEATARAALAAARG